MKKPSNQLFKPDSIVIPPYHVFTIHDEYFLFYTHSKIAHKIEEIFFHFLEHRLIHTTVESTQYLYRENIPKIKLSHVLSYLSSWLKTLHHLLWIASKDKHILIFFGISKAEIFLATSCNWACIYDFCRENNTNNNHLMTIDTAKRWLTESLNGLKNKRDWRLIFWGEEPLFNTPVLQYIG